MGAGEHREDYGETHMDGAKALLQAMQLGREYKFSKLTSWMFGQRWHVFVYYSALQDRGEQAPGLQCATRVNDPPD